MKLSKLADITEIVTSIAILATLVYLAVEIDQNTKALNGQTRQAVLDASQVEIFEFADNPELVNNIIREEPLSEAENVQLHMALIATMRLREFSWLQFNEGTIDQSQWATEYGVMRILLGTPRTRHWWITLGRPAFSTEFVAFVDESLEDFPVTNEHWRLMQTWTQQQ
jgi:hypothetical protein